MASGGIADAAAQTAGAFGPTNPMAQNAQSPAPAQAGAVIAAAKDAWAKMHDSPQRNPMHEAALQAFVAMFGQNALRWLDQEVKRNPPDDIKMRNLQAQMSGEPQ